MIGKRKLTSLVSSLMAGVILMSACSVNMDGIGEAFSNLENNLNEASREEQEASVTTIEVTVETSAEETEPVETTVEAEPTATPVPTATPTPSPTPVPERVDFSDLTEDALSDTIYVETEDFSESAHALDDDDIVLAKFMGERMLLSSDDELASVVSVNLMLDAFYMEAEGLYNRYVNEQYAAYALDAETVPATKIVTVDYEYFFNGRLLCVIMDYAVTEDDEVLVSSTEYYRFDLYTGQIIYSDMMVNDVDAFYDELAEAVADSTSSRTDTAEDYHIEFFVVETDEDGQAEVTAAVTTDEGFVYYVVELPDLYENLTRYGRVVWGVTAPVEVEEDEEDIEDEESEEPEESEEDEDAEDEEPAEDEEGEEVEETEQTESEDTEEEEED